jgi:hypothetical protein
MDDERALRAIIRVFDWPCTFRVGEFTFLPIVGKLFVMLAFFSNAPEPFFLFGCYLMLLGYGRDRRLLEETCA